MARTARRRSSGRRSPSRKKIWARTTIQSTSLGTNLTTHSLVLGSFETEYGAQLIGCTILRTRLSLFTQSDGAGSGGLIYGLRVADVDQVTDLAVAPDYGPGTRRHLDWMAWGLVTQVNANDRAVADVDVRSMRKVDELGENLVLSIQNAGAVPILWGGAISVLVALP